MSLVTDDNILQESTKVTIEEYKLLFDIYYKEVSIFYAKNTIFTTIQIFLLGCYLINSDKFFTSINTHLKLAVLFVFCSFSLVQILICKRGYDVNQAVIDTISEFENKSGFTILNRFSIHVNKKNRIGKMNFPSYTFIILSCVYLIFWILILCYESNILNLISLLNPPKTILSEKLLKNILLLVISLMFAVAMKLADLFNEHGLKWFKGDAILFGVLWGILGSLLILINPIIANIILAMNLCFILRGLIDYPNHCIACVMQISLFVLTCKVDTGWFIYFMICFIVLGFIKNLKYLKNKNLIVKCICKFYIYVPVIYAFPTLLYAVITSDWIIFFSLFVFDFTYNIVRLVAEKGIKQYYE